jgi:uncharacterized protein YbjT (DUF2867 family)
MTESGPRIIVLGAAGLIGNFVAADLIRRGMTTIAIARRFTDAQRSQFGDAARATQVVQLDISGLTRLFQETEADVVLNCLGVLQNMPGDRTHNIHQGFVERLLAALRAISRPILLVHVSIPGAESGDRTEFARTKRAADKAIAQSGLPYAILRPGFVFAPSAFGGSALLRALAALPIELPSRLAAQPFAIVAIEDIAETVVLLARQRAHMNAVVWDLMHPELRTLGDALKSLRTWLGSASHWHIRLPGFLLKLGVLAGDAVSWLGWRPSLRSTALAELQRGVAGDPRAWMTKTGITPRSLDDVLHANPATVQEKWFARLYPLKALVIAALAIFWCASALIALTIAYPAAVAILTVHGYSDAQAHFMTVAGSVMDFSIGVAIAFRRSNRWALLAGVAVSLFYMLAAALLTPELWVEPLGA